MKVLNLNGTLIDFETSVNYMDDDLREKVHFELSPCTDQEFFTSYEVAYIIKFGEQWELSKENPAW